jgi:hypothetical protein
LQSVRELRVDIWGNDQQDHLLELGWKLADCLARMPNLKTLSLSATTLCSDALETAFKERGLDFPQVQTLAVGHHVAWLIHLCSHVHQVSSDDWILDPKHTVGSGTEFIRAASKAQLLSFTFHAKWNALLLEDVWRFMPQLKTLGLHGMVMSFDQVLAVLRKFRNLEVLTLADAERLTGLEYPDSDCRWWPQKKITYAQEAAVRAVFQNVPSVRELRLGQHFRAWIVQHDTHSLVEVRWEVSRPGQFDQWLDQNKALPSETQDPFLLEHVDPCDTQDPEDETNPQFSEVEDTRSIFSRADTLAM